MGTVFHVTKEGKLNKDGKPRGCWRYEDKKSGIRDTLNEPFANQIKRLREGGVTLSIEEIVDQLLELKNTNSLKSGLTVNEYVDKYIEDKVSDYRDKSNRTEKKIKKFEWRQRHYLSHFVKMYKNKRLDDITVEDIKTFYRIRRASTRKLKNGVKNLEKDTIVLELVFVRVMYNHAIRFGVFRGVNPVNQAGITKENKRRSRVLTPEEQERLLKVCNRDLRHLIILLLNTGCRIGEILCTQWSWIDFDKRILHLPEYATKTEQERDVRLNQVSVAILRERKLLTRGSEYIFPATSKLAGVGHRTWIYTGWYNALKRAGITDLNPHDLRHTFATRLKALRTDGAVVQEALGHTDYKTTQHYVHVEDEVIGAVDLLGFTYFGAKSEEKSA